MSGSGTQIPVVTVDIYGRITSISTQTVTPAWSAVTGTPTTVAGYGITDAVGTSRTLTGTSSITGGGDLTANRTFSLVGDSAAPGNSYYYGTDGGGAKGYYAFPAAGGTGTVTSVIAGAGLTGGTINTAGTIALAASGATAGTYKSVTVDTYGRVTGGTNPTTLAGYGITDAVPSTASISGGTSLAGGGALSGAPLTITLVNDAAAPGNDYYYGTNAAGVKGYYVLPAGGGGGGSGTVTSIIAGTGLTGGTISTSGTIALAASGITAGTYNGITFDAQGRATVAVDSGFVVGPASATDNAVARYDAATGKLIQGSGVIIDDSGNVGVGGVTSPRARIEIDSHGGWGGNNYGKGLYITSSGLSNPAIGLSDSSGNNNIAISNGNGRLAIAHMPAITDSTTAPVERIILEADGRVGIGTNGTTTPPFPFTAGYSATDGAWVTGSAFATSLGLGGYNGSTDGSFQIKYNRSNGLASLRSGPRDSPVDVVNIATNGYVGFSVGTPRARVDVNGSVVQNTINTTGAMDVLLSNMFACTVTGATAFTFFNTPASAAMTVVLNVANGGAHAITWPASLRFPGGTAPALTAVGVDILVFITYDGGTSWRGNVFGKNI